MTIQWQSPGETEVQELMVEELSVIVLLLKPKEQIPLQGKRAGETSVRQISEKQAEPVNEKSSNQDLQSQEVYKLTRRMEEDKGLTVTNSKQENYKSPHLGIQKVTGNDGENCCCEKEGNKIDTTDILSPPPPCFGLLDNTKEKIKREEVEEKGKRRKNKKGLF